MSGLSDKDLLSREPEPVREGIRIKAAPLEIVWRLRKEVMYPEYSIEMVKLADDEKGIHLGVYLDGDQEPVSVISFFVEQDHCQFRKFATRNAFQGKGYGTLLLGHVMKLAEARQHKVIWCNARITALGLYEKMGMQAVGATWEKFGHTFIKMEKKWS
jgi:phosphoribosylformimino-5-aminoimidazole carboxamide ribotide isomerase